MKTVKVKVVTGVSPSYKTPGAAGCDLFIAESCMLAPGDTCTVSTRLFIEVPDGYEAQVRSRSGLVGARQVSVLNSPGTIDSDYRGEIKVILHNHGVVRQHFTRGDRIAQLVFAPVVRAKFVRGRATKTRRGAGGFGSTGTK